MFEFMSYPMKQNILKLLTETSLIQSEKNDSSSMRTMNLTLLQKTLQSNYLTEPLIKETSQTSDISKFTLQNNMNFSQLL